jgi:filamentous hemagglutinin family protein
MTLNWQSSRWKLCLAVPIFTGWLVASIDTSAVAQITPDGTLGNEASQVKPINNNVDRIDGGAVRGSNLFHSFQDFNVGEGRGAYFANPAGVENILSRVTGNNPSNIFGTLGVLGNANLFLLNPNGIIFGPNAKLDIRGSFVGSAAGGVNFSDRTFFGGKSQTTPLLTMAVPVGLQYGTQQAGNISNSGNLAVGQDLTLSASNLDLQGKLEAGRNLTLQANDTVRVRDSVESPFLARAGGNLSIQGNQGIDILALNHPGTPFQSGGNLSLVSDGIISGDAHFASGGNFSISNLARKPGNFVSLYDPIISATGDVTFGNYTGVALKVEATGSITGGNIRITGSDTSLTGSDPDIPILTSSPALIMRAGLTTLSNASNVPQTTEGTNFTPTGLQSSNGGIKVGNIDTSSNVSNGGSVSLSSSGDITTGFITTAPDNSENLAAVRIRSFNGSVKITNFTEGQKDSIFARSITIDAPGILDIAGDLNTRINNSQNTGNISIGKSSPPSSISINTIGTRNLNGGEGGNIDITTTGLLNIKGIFSRGLNGDPIQGVNSSNTTNDFLSIASEANSKGGDITINAAGGIKTAAGIVSNSRISGNGGNITLNGGNGAITIAAGTVDSSSKSGSGGNIKLDAAGNINVGSIFSFSSGTGRGGDITLISQGGTINTVKGILNASSINNTFGVPFAEASTGIPFNNGGNVSLEAKNGDILSGSIESTGLQGGRITLNSGGKISVNKNGIASVTTGSGRGGNIEFTAKSIELTDGMVASITLLGDGQNGDIVFKASDSIKLTNTNESIPPEVGNPLFQSLASNFSGTGIANVAFEGNGNGGNINISTKKLTILNQFISDTNGKNELTGITTSTRGSIGTRGGNITIEDSELVEITGNQKL